MNQSDKLFLDDKLNKEILAAIQTPIADDDPDLLEFEDAMEEWTNLQKNDPLQAADIRNQTLSGYEDLLLRMEKESAVEGHTDLTVPVCNSAEKVVEDKEKPVSIAEERGKRSGSWRKKKKVLLIVAAIMALGLGTTMVAEGDRWYKLQQFPIQKQRTVIVSHNSVIKDNQVGKLEKAYLQIYERLGIDVCVLGEIPSGMKFKRLTLDETHAVLEFLYEKNSIYFEQRKVPKSNQLANVIVSDRKDIVSVYNKWLNKDISIGENILSDGYTEYSAVFENGESIYYLSGRMNKEEFIELVSNIYIKYDMK